MSTVQIVIVIAIIGIAIFLYYKNKQENRRIERRNRLAEKQEELIRSLTSKKDTTDNNEN